MASNQVFKLMIYSIVINFAVGILLATIPNFNTDFADGTSEYTYGLTYNASYSDNFDTTMVKNVTPSGALEDTGNSIYRVLDMLTIGFFSVLINTIEQYMFGFIVMLERMFSNNMSIQLSNMIFSSLKALISIGYVIGIWSLWTGKDMRD